MICKIWTPITTINRDVLIISQSITQGLAMRAVLIIRYYQPRCRAQIPSPWTVFVKQSNNPEYFLLPPIQPIYMSSLTIEYIYINIYIQYIHVYVQIYLRERPLEPSLVESTSNGQKQVVLTTLLVSDENRCTLQSVSYIFI